MRLDLVMPAHNEERRIGPTLRAYCDAFGPEVRLFVALDDCTDDTAAVVKAVAGDDPRVVVRTYPRLGKGGVLLETFRGCDAELIGFVDADGSTPAGEVRRLAEVANHDGVGGATASRRHSSAVVPIRRSRTRRVTSSAFSALVRRLFALPFGDTQCGAKVFRREVVHDCLPYVASRDFLFDVDVLLTATRRGHRIIEVPTVWIDKEGSRVAPVRDSVRMVLSSLRLWLQHRVQPFPVAGQDIAPVITLHPTVAPEEREATVADA